MSFSGHVLPWTANGVFLPVLRLRQRYKPASLNLKITIFFHHWGVNPVSIGRAAYQNLKAGRVISGGSTITMQTIRLARNNPRTFSEKFIEMIWATRLEFRYSKEKILSLYVSHAPFGGNVVGLDAAPGVILAIRQTICQGRSSYARRTSQFSCHDSSFQKPAGIAR